MRVLVLKPYPDDSAPSQRFRFEQYAEFLQENNIIFYQVPFIDISTWRILYKEGHFFAKLKGIILGFLSRINLLFQIYKFQYVLVHREATPIGPPVIEWIIVRIFRKKIIYDFDDAIWLYNTSQANRLASFFKRPEKTAKICQWSHKISCGNHYLAEYARQFNSQVKIIPTTIDTINHHNLIANQETSPLKIGWTGSHSTLQYLYPVLPILQRLYQYHSFEFWVIADKRPVYNLPFIKFIPFEKNSEISTLSHFHMGIMPLDENPWSLGKCGFKILQYMALGIPAIAGNVGTNKAIIDHGSNGYLCTRENDWYNYLELLIKNQRLRENIGKAGRQTILDKYSVLARKEDYLNLFS